MKHISSVGVFSVLFLAIAPASAMASTFFTDDFSHGSTLNGVSNPGGTPTASFTSYDFASSKNSTVSTIAPSLLSGKISSATTSGYWEMQALFTTNPVVLTVPGDYIDLAIVFTNSAGTLLTGTASPIWVGLYNSGAAPGSINPPVAGTLANAGLNTTAGSTYATGNCADWAGYVGQVYSGTGSRIITRPIQNGTGTTSANQELLGNGVSGGTFNNPGGAALVTSAAQTFTLATTAAYTLELRITLDPAGSGNLIISNAVYSGVGTGGPIVFSNIVSTANVIASAFDGLALGAFNHNGSYIPQIDVSSISITGQSTPVTTPPDITTEPSPVVVATNGSCAFSVAAQGFNVTYQWARNGTNLLDGGNISGSHSDTLIISPAGTADQLSGANGYYVIVSGAGGYSTNSITNSLALIPATNLVWNAANGNVWDLNTTANWQDTNGNPAFFNYGDPVTFDDTGAGNPFVTLSGSFLSASSVTVNGNTTYSFSGTGSFAGPGNLIYEGNAQLIINNANTYSGGTIISNANANLLLNNYNGLGTGPVTLAQAGGKMEIVPAGSGSLGVKGDIVVADDFTITYDASSSYGAVFLGNLSGNASKTLTINYNNSTGAVSRVRILGGSTVYNGNLNLSDSRTVWATYQASGTQTYNGIISGSGAFMQKGTITYLNGANTYTGGTYPATGAIGIGNDSALGSGSLILVPDSTTSLTGSGQIFASGAAHTIANPVHYPSGTNNLTLIVGGSTNLTLSGQYNLNGDDNITTNTFMTRTIQVTNTALTLISGVISDYTNGVSAGYGLTKTGNGVLALSATETYTGPTTISGGTLLVNGQIGTGAVTATNGTLGGSGIVGGAVTIHNGGGLSPGNQGIGTLTINNTLTLLGGSTSSIEVNKTAGTHDLVTASTVNYGGTLFATNLSGTLTTSDSFQVFSAGSRTGTFTNIIGSPGLGLAWSFNPTNGTLNVVTGVNPNPTNITFSVSGNTLGLSWPADHTGWTLEVQTNALAGGLQINSNAWVRVPNSALVNQTNFVINPANGSVFYRLVYP